MLLFLSLLLSFGATCECVCTDGVELGPVEVTVPEPPTCDTDPPADTASPVDTEDTAAPSGPAHVVLVILDDMGPAVPGYAGGPGLTPALDTLAASGVVLEQAYAHPVCSPSRLAALGGRHPYRDMPVNHASRSGRLPVLSRSVAAAFRDAGWRTALFGKWHLDGYNAAENKGVPAYYPAGVAGWQTSPTVAGFDRWEAATNTMSLLLDEPWLLGRQDGVFVERPASAEHAIALVDLALEHIDAAPGPAFVVVAPSQTHEPFASGTAADLALVDALLPGANDATRRYYAEVSSVDRAIGHLTAGLDARGLLSDTLIVVYGDNGGIRAEAPGATTPAISPSPVLGREQKGSAYQGGVEVPAVVSWPAGLPMGTTATGLVMIHDLPATLGTLAGVDVASVLLQPTDGEDRTAALYGASDRVAGFAVREPGGRTGWVNPNGRWKLIRPPGGNESGTADEFYELWTDPGETTNVKSANMGNYYASRNALNAWLDSAAISRTDADYPPGESTFWRDITTDWSLEAQYAPVAAALCARPEMAGYGGCP